MKITIEFSEISFRRIELEVDDSLDLRRGDTTFFLSERIEEEFGSSVEYDSRSVVDPCVVRVNRRKP